jgi:fatty acid desaturase
MLRYRADVRTLAFVGFYYALLIAEWNLIDSPFSLKAVPLVVLTAAVSWICAVITHNTLHTPVFKQRWANKVFQVALTCAYGFPVSEYVPGHNLSHHKHTQKRADLMRTSKARFTTINVLNLLVFFPRVGADIFTQNYRYVGVMKKRIPAWYHQLMIEMVICWGSKAVLFLIDWRKALLFVAIPHLWAVYGITTVNFLQHDGCDEDDPLNHSRNFVGRIFNWFTFNNGFHGYHHDEPGLHWSLLPAAHVAKYGGKIHPALEQKSLAVYLFRTFVFPGKRLRYDGKPVILPEVGPDEEWIPVSIESAIADLGAEGTAMSGAE